MSILANILELFRSKRVNPIDCGGTTRLDLSLAGDEFAAHAQESLNLKIRMASTRSSKNDG